MLSWKGTVWFEQLNRSKKPVQRPGGPSGQEQEPEILHLEDLQRDCRLTCRLKDFTHPTIDFMGILEDLSGEQAGLTIWTTRVYLFHQIPV